MGNLLIQGLVSGILLGMIYGLIGAGLNMIYGVMRVVNFAHGEFLMIAAYVVYWFGVLYNIDPLTSLIVIIPSFFLAGLIIYYLMVPRLLRSEDPEMASFLAFYGISMIITALVLIVWGSDPRGVKFPYSIQTIRLGPLFLSPGRVIHFAFSAAVAGALAFFLYHTYTGKAIRAIIQNRDAVKIVGIDPNRISAIAFGIGLMLVGMTGALIPLTFPGITPGMGAGYTLTAFVVIVLGGLGNPMGSLVGGLIFGLTENLSAVFLPLALSPLVSFVFLIVIIMVRPQGFLGGSSS